MFNFRLSSSDQDYTVAIAYIGSPAVFKEKLVAGTETPLAYSIMKNLLEGDKAVGSVSTKVCTTVYSISG